MRGDVRSDHVTTAGFFPRCKQLGKCFRCAVEGRVGDWRERLRESPHHRLPNLKEDRGLSSRGVTRPPLACVSWPQLVVAMLPGRRGRGTVATRARCRVAAAAFQDIIEGRRRPMQRVRTELGGEGLRALHITLCSLSAIDHSNN